MRTRLFLAVLLIAASPAAALAQAAGPDAPSPEWWTDPQGGWVGGIAGSAVGLLGALVGTLAGLGVARRLTLTFATLGVLVGLVCLAVGVVALVLGQPYHVWYPPLLVGAISAFAFGLNLPGLKKRYDQLELRKMTALDA